MGLLPFALSAVCSVLPLPGVFLGLKPHAQGGLDLSRYSASATLAVLIVACILIFPQRAGAHPKNLKPEAE